MRFPAQLAAHHGGWVRPLAIAACCAYPLLNHFAAVLDEPRLAALGIALIAWALATGWLSTLAATLAAASALPLLLWLAAGLPGLLLYAPPVAINLALLAFFGRTLRAGREPLVTGFARVGRGGSLFSNVLNYLLVALLFVLEYIYRRMRYRHHPHASPRQMIRLLRNFRMILRSHGQPVE